MLLSSYDEKKRDAPNDKLLFGFASSAKHSHEGLICLEALNMFEIVATSGWYASYRFVLRLSKNGACLHFDSHDHLADLEVTIPAGMSPPNRLNIRHQRRPQRVASHSPDDTAT